MPTKVDQAALQELKVHHNKQLCYDQHHGVNLINTLLFSADSST